MAANESSHLSEMKKNHPDTDLKKLKSQYGPKLSTLRELFAGWSDDDLIFALKEADGDLELAIDRISSGVVNQWGEVKTKKAKKESQQKAKTDAAVAANQQQHQQSPSVYSSQQRSDRSQKGSDRGSRGRDASTRGRPSNIGNRGAPPSNRSNAPSRRVESSTDASGSWASIASSQKPDVQAASSGWDAPVTSSSNDISWSDSPAPTTTTSTTAAASQQPSTSTSEPATAKPSSWASLLKSQPKPEPPKQETKEETAETSGWEAPAASEKPAISEWDLPIQTQGTAVAVEEESTIVPTVPEPVSAEQETAVPEPVAPVEPSKPAELTGVKSKTPIGRRLKQDAPVVMPGGSAGLSTMGVKFGSLNLNDEDVNETEEAVPASLQQEEDRHAVKEPLATESAYVNRLANTNATNLTGVQSTLPQETSQALKQEQAPAQPPFQQQQQQQQQHFGMDHLNSPYGSYLHNQLPGGFSGFGMNPMGSIPDYGLYGNEAQRAAAMGLYDPSAYGHSPSVTAANAYQGRDKLAQEGSQTGTATTAAAQSQADTLHSQQAQQQHQPGYPNMPYYPYYYMPNQFNAHYGSGFGQPFVNKNMYPMYSGKPNAPSSPYATTGSPYASQQHLYGLPGANSPYDDMNASQQQQAPGLGGNGIFDYKKQVYGNPQLQDFLGAQSQTQAQPRQAGQQGQAGQTSKSDLRGQGQGQQQPAPQQQQQHYPQQGYYQQQAFSSYGQYTQGQQHAGNQQQQQPQQQQPQPQQQYQPRSQYWNQ